MGHMMDEEARLWTLNPYELNRTPQHIPPTDTRIVHTTGRILEQELQCAICLDILRNTRTTKECLHRFCDDCISQALRNGNRECPNCRTKLISMRSLRPDPLFDDIIRVLFPNRREMDEQNAAKLALLATGSEPRRRRRGAGGGGGAGGSGPAQAKVVAPAVEEDDGVPVVCMELRPYERKMVAAGQTEVLEKWKPAKRFVRVKGSAKVDHVCRFILTRLLVERQNSSVVDINGIDVSKVQIYLKMAKNDYHLLQHSLTLLDVHERYWNIGRPMKFAFAFSGNIKLK
ncbi:E3 ubiquitin-protein ligase RING2-like [Paramacrobiotus metropolitanus]|uniref:E3 ubiquitin-protein ligase RING2-like n=1 Tax=Paramacrobiotus metropolitanus TaxID=2943436 RepID=UPI002445D871|nr:E3 ubiquitin-protein ligase RING2-like [Paramacrobiotus metropolitanus]